MAEGCPKAEWLITQPGEGQREKSGGSSSAPHVPDVRRAIPGAFFSPGNPKSPRGEAFGGLLVPTSMPRCCQLSVLLLLVPFPHGRLYISAKFELMMGAVFVILHQAALVSGIYLSCCFGSFFQSLLSSDMSGLQSKRNSGFTFTVRQAECYYPCICHQPADPSL